MRSAKSIMLRKLRLCLFLLFFLSLSVGLLAQGNSPYSRFGLGDISSGTNVTSRGMGGISAAYADPLSVNFNNPASYAGFQTILEQRSKKLASGRVVLDVGTSFESRSLIAPNTAGRFTSTDLLFSYLQVGLPLKKNWGLSFGIRPVYRINYLINRDDSLKDPVTGNTIERAITQFRGSGGTYLPSIGTGFAIKNLSVGFNVGYLFGNRENVTFRSLINDSILYYSSEHRTNTSLGNLFFNGGMQYLVKLRETNEELSQLRLGISGNWKQNISASRDVVRQTFTRGAAGEELRIDSVFENNGVSGEVVYPSSFKAGFVFQKNKKNVGSGWMVGADYTTSKWSDYRFFGQSDSVQDSRMVNVGMQWTPRPRGNYFSAVTYRLGLFTGKDYIKVGDDLPVLGASFGMGLPMRPSRMAPNQYSVINLSLEYSKRGNNDNRLKENLFRLSLGLNFTDLWFGKRKYE